LICLGHHPGGASHGLQQSDRHAEGVVEHAFRSRAVASGQKRQHSGSEAAQAKGAFHGGGFITAAQEGKPSFTNFAALVAPPLSRWHGHGLHTMASNFGTLFRISTLGESHGVGVGVVVDGCPPRIPLTGPTSSTS
jgi:hypothetical protein